MQSGCGLPDYIRATLCIYRKGCALSDKNYLLAIDNGTQSIRALLFDLQGNLLGKGKVELEAYYSKQPGWAEQDPEYYWASLGEACA